jgi:hypothetical protein
MPYVHDLRCRVQGRRVSSRFYTAKEPAGAGMLDIPLYRQDDGHSCGFLATLAVVRYFAPQTPILEVLRAVAPSSVCECGRRHVVRCLKRFGIVPEYRERLGLRTLRRLIAHETPVIVTLWPEGYFCDHWTVVRGIDLRRRRVFLTNYGEVVADADGSMAWTAFLAAGIRVVLAGSVRRDLVA